MEKLKDICIGKKCVVRCDTAGVYFGEVISKTETNIVMKNVRKLWHWDGACAVEELAVNGVSNPDACKFTVVVALIELSRYSEALPCTPKSIKSLSEVPEWKRG